jgi:YHS domain-containing protein
MIYKRFILLALASLLYGVILNAWADPEINTYKSGIAGAIGMRSDVAILGYDTVSYHNEGIGIQGEEKFSYEWKKAIWLFANENNLTLFKNDPEKYAPMYGGYCAYGLAEGGLHGIDPTKFEISQGKLYLNNDESSLKKWIKMSDSKYKQANENYKAFTNKDVD